MDKRKLLIAGGIFGIIGLTMVITVTAFLYSDYLSRERSNNKVVQNSSTVTPTPSVTTLETSPSVAPTHSLLRSELVFKNQKIGKSLIATTAQDLADNQCEYSLIGAMFYYDEQSHSGMTIIPFSSVSGKPQQVSYLEAVDYLLKKKNSTTMDQGAPSVFTVSCGGAYYEYVKEIPVTYPNTDAARSNYYMGGTQFAPGKLEEVNTTISVYAKKGNFIYSLSKSISAALVFTEAETKHCFKSLNDTFTYDFVCLAKTAQEIPNFDQRLKNYTERLVSDFAIE